MTPDDLIQPVLDRQHGLVTPAQALARGMTRGAFEHRVGAGRLRRVHRGVYRAPSSPCSLEQRVLAACLACGDGAVASHVSAAMLFGLVDRADGPAHVTMNTSGTRRIAAVIVHRGRLREDDRSRVGVIPVTAVPRTLVDLAAALPERALAEATDRAARRKLIQPTRLDAAVRDARFDRYPGIGALRRITSDRAQAGVPGSVLEADMIELLRAFRLPEPVRQHEVRAKGRRVVFDLAYPQQRVAIELDGRMPHSEFPTWQRDHNRHNATELGGWVTLRFTWWDVHETPTYVAATVAEALGLRPTGWRPVRRSRTP